MGERRHQASTHQEARVREARTRRKRERTRRKRERNKRAELRAQRTAEEASWRSFETAACRMLVVAIALFGSLHIWSAVAPEEDPLPNVLRIDEQSLSALPIELNSLQMCNCWAGPRDQAQRKIKVEVVNHSESAVNIGGGDESQVRLLVGYSGMDELSVTVGAGRGRRVRVQLPPDVSVYLARTVETLVAPRLSGSANDIFGIPNSYSIFAIPPNNNLILEDNSPSPDELASGGIFGTFPTYVDTEVLLPGESYYDGRPGRGDWVFPLPLPDSIAPMFRGDWILGVDRQDFDEYLMVIGVAVIEPDGVISGFAPTPPVGLMSDVSDF